MNGDSPERGEVDALVARIRKAQEAANPARRLELKGWGETSRRTLRAVRVGSDFVASIMVPTAVGWLVDREWGTAPWVMLGLLGAGFGIGVFVLVKAFDGAGGGKRQEDGDRKE